MCYDMEKPKKSYLKYSVLMSVYEKDKPEYLRLSIESMLNQTIRPEQFVLVIDGPVSEKIKEVIDTYSGDKRVFTIIELKKNGGLGRALNIGLQSCRNELVARMDADDISLPNRCEKILQCFEEDNSLDICGCNIDEFFREPNNIKTSRIVPSENKEIKQFMRRRQAFNHPTVIYRKTKVLQSGGYQKLKRKEDFDLFSRMLVNGCKSRNVSESLYLYRADENNYRRRKSWDNLKSAIYVYWRHWKRKGCSTIDFLIICCSEMIFFIAPYPVMKWFSDRFLRRKKNVRYRSKHNHSLL